MTKVTFKAKTVTGLPGQDGCHPERIQLEQEWEFTNTDEIASFFRTAKDAQDAGWSFEIVKVESDS
jgi:hypothetical protein|tara:strand:- start:535 stop:732 length:198 start_codon:yes stop_codon:yes gene_type:complete